MTSGKCWTHEANTQCQFNEKMHSAPGLTLPLHHIQNEFTGNSHSKAVNSIPF